MFYAKEALTAVAARRLFRLNSRLAAAGVPWKDFELQAFANQHQRAKRHLCHGAVCRFPLLHSTANH